MNFRLHSTITLLAACSLAGIAWGQPSELKRNPERNYEEYCAGCHGMDGKAKTRLGRKSGAKDLTDAARMAKLTDQDAFNGVKFGRKNKAGDEVMDSFKKDLTDDEIRALVVYVRTFSTTNPAAPGRP